MRASIIADSGRGPGYGIIEIFEAGAVAAPVFLLLRASDGKCLSSRGWQESETQLTPDAWDNDGGSLRLAVGPAVVDEVDNLDAYRITLPGLGSCALAVKNIVYSHIAGGHGMGSAAMATVVAATAAPTPPEPAPQPEPEPIVEASPEPPLEMAGQHTEQPETKSGKTGMILLLVLAALAAGAAVWWFLLREPEKTPLPAPPDQTQSAPAPNKDAKPDQAPDQKSGQNPDQTPGKTPADDKAKQDGSAQGAGADQGGKPQTLSPLASAREQLRGAALPDVSLGMAKPMRKADATPEESDAAFLLLEDAAQKGNADAMFLAGQFYDPGSQLPRGSIPADLTQAKRWYDEAQQKGQPEAKAALDALKEKARALDAKGDAEAHALLQNWQ